MQLLEHPAPIFRRLAYRRPRCGIRSGGGGLKAFWGAFFLIFTLSRVVLGAAATDVTLAWNKNPEKDVAGYELRYGTRSGEHPQVLDVGPRNLTKVTGLQPGVTYYFVVRAYNRSGQRSRPSAEITHRTPAPPVNRAPDTRMVIPHTHGTVVAGQALRFSALASDPDGRPGLSIRWNFGLDSGLADVEGPNVEGVRFNTPGTFLVTATAIDAQGLADPTPAARQITVLPAWSPVPRDGWKIVSATSEETDGYAASLAIDGNPDTFWHTRWRTNPVAHPHSIVIDLGKPRRIKGFLYLPRQDGIKVGAIGRYQFHVSMDGKDWGNAVANGSFTASSEKQTALTIPKTGRFVRLTSLSEQNGGIHCSIAEFEVLDGPPANRRPVAAPGLVTVSRNSSARIALRGSDPDGNPLTYQILNLPRNGRLTGTYPDLVYRPKPGFTGTDRFTFRVHDGVASSRMATIRIRVTAPGKPPAKALAAPVARTQSATTRKSPAMPAGAPDPRPAIAGSIVIDGRKHLTLTLPKSGSGAPFRPVIEVSSNLVDWFSGPRHTTVIADNERFLMVRDNTPVTPGRKRHIRVMPASH